MDLTSRKAVHDGMTKYGFVAPDMTVHEFVKDELPPVPAVPLDKLCDVLSSHSLDIFTAEHCCLMSEEFWKSKIIEWMEGLDGIESMAQKT